MKNMNENPAGLMPWRMALLATTLASTLLAGCGGGGSGRDPILGAGVATLGPVVVMVTPVPNAVGVTISNPVINATFSEPVAPIAGAASFNLTCAQPCVNPTGTVALDASNKTATYTVTSGTTLAPSTVYSATVAGATSLANGTSQAAPYTWSFTTGVAPDLVPPRVASTVPVTNNPGPTVAANTAISAVFTKEMAPATISATSFTVTCGAPCVSPVGTVGYTVGVATANFVPNAPLQAGVTYTATITSAATDLAGNRLAGNQAPAPSPSNYIWTFTIAGVAAPTPVTVSGTSPMANAVGVCPSATINATFTVPFGLRMDAATINATTFTVTDAALVPVVASSITLDNASGTIATFTPAVPLIANTTYLGRIKGGAAGVKDLATPANVMVMDYTWSFTAGPATGSCLAMTPVPLNSASTFGTFGGSAGATNMGLLSTVHGDMGTTAISTAVTGFHDAGPGCTYTETPLNQGLVTGKIYTAAPPPTVACPSEGNAATFLIATNARGDALAAYNALVAMPAGSDPGAGSLSGLTLAPGVYTSASGTFMIQGKDLTLDAQGNPNAVFVFQMAKTLTVGGPGAAAPQSVILINGAQAKNVFWQVGSAATINAGGGGTMVGTIISQAGVAFSTAGNVAIVTLNGRALSLGASVTMVNTVINVPAP